MIPKLSNNPKFVEDYKNYQKRISAVTDENLKKDLIDALIKLREHIQYVDRSHEQILFTGHVPNSEISELRTSVARYKKILDNKLQAWERAQTIKPELRPNEE